MSDAVGVKVTKKEHNEVFPKDPCGWASSIDYYYDPHRALFKCERYPSKMSMTLEWSLYPVGLVMFGVRYLKEYTNDLWELTFPKKYSRHSTTYIPRGSKEYSKLMAIYNKRCQ